MSPQVAPAPHVLGQQVIGTAADVAGDAVGNAMGVILQPVLEASIEPILRTLVPKIGEMTAEKMIKDLSKAAPKLADVPNLVEEVTKGTSNIMMSFREELLEYCGDVVRCDIAKGFENVVLDLMRAILYGIWEAEEVVWSLVPGYAGSVLRFVREFDYAGSSPCNPFIECFFPEVDLEDVVVHAFELMKGSLRVELKKGNIPPQLAELLPWNVTDELTQCRWKDVATAVEDRLPPPKSGKKHHPDTTRTHELGSQANTYAQDAEDDFGHSSSFQQSSSF